MATARASDSCLMLDYVRVINSRIIIIIISYHQSFMHSFSVTLRTGINYAEVIGQNYVTWPVPQSSVVWLRPIIELKFQFDQACFQAREAGASFWWESVIKQRRKKKESKKERIAHPW